MPSPRRRIERGTLQCVVLFESVGCCQRLCVSPAGRSSRAAPKLSIVQAPRDVRVVVGGCLPPGWEGRDPSNRALGIALRRVKTCGFPPFWILLLRALRDGIHEASGPPHSGRPSVPLLLSIPMAIRSGEPATTRAASCAVMALSTLAGPDEPCRPMSTPARDAQCQSLPDWYPTSSPPCAHTHSHTRRKFTR